MKPRRKGLNPAQLTLIYCLVAVLIIIHQADGLAGWLDDIGHSGQSRFHHVALYLAADIRAKSEQSGLTALTQGESRILAALTPTWEIGGFTGSGKPSDRHLKSTDLNKTNSHSDQKATVISLASRKTRDQKAGSPIAGSQSATSPSTDSPSTDSQNAASSPAGANEIFLTVDRNSLTATPQNPPTIYDTDLQTLAIPLQPKPSKEAGFLSQKPLQKVFLTGDSMMIEGIGPPLERHFKSIEGLTVIRKGHYSTGLCRLDFFDWIAHFKSILTENEPDLVVITLGANDSQDIVVEGRKRHLVTSPGWNEIYGQRVTEMVQSAAKAEAQVLWLGLPIMGREPYNTRIQNLSEVTKTACQKEDNCIFWDASSSLTDKNGKFSTFLTVKDGSHVKVRAKDSIHLTEKGGQQMLNDLLDDNPFLAADKLQISVASASEGIASAANAPAAGQAPDRENSSDPAALLTANPSPVDIPVEAGKPPVVKAQNESVGHGPKSLANKKPVLPPKDAAPFGRFTLTETVLASNSQGQTHYKVAVPVEAPGKLLPAVMLLHGAEGDQNFFVSGLGDSLIDMATRFGVIFIMPNGGPFGWYLDSPLKADSQIATYIMSELMPDALARYPIDPDRLAILGISMGGHGALTLAINNPDRFKAVSLLSAVIDLESHKTDNSLNRYLRLQEILGPSELAQDQWRNHSAYYLSRHHPEILSRLGLSLVIGRADKLCLAENRQYDRLLNDLGIAHQYTELSGGHGWNLWKSVFPAQMAFLTDYL
jgi:S-formylglutathione hydrolase FrmB